MRNKYRIFLITQVSKDGGADHEKAKTELAKLVAAGVVKDHRVMYCSTVEGKKSLVRQLSAELHIETDPSIVSGLSRFMNKFHLIGTSATREEASRVGKENASKVVVFKSARSYAAKLLPAFKASS